MKEQTKAVQLDIPGFLAKLSAFAKAGQLYVPGQPLLLAVSGGLDSVVLCDAISRLQIPFVIAHVNYGLRGAESDRDEAFVRALSEKYKAPIRVLHADTSAFRDLEGGSVQEAARHLRYRWFAQLLQADHEIWSGSLQQGIGQGLKPRLLTAHHLDDNIETVVLNFCRGAGISGLRGMLPATAEVARPLLWATRQALQHYAQLADLRWVEDSSNAELKYTRNRIRHTLVPQIEAIFPGFRQALVTQLDRYRDMEVFLHQSIDEKLSRWVVTEGEEHRLPVNRLRKSAGALTILHRFLAGFGFNAAQAGEVTKLLEAGSGRQVLGETHRVFRHREWLVLAPRETENPLPVYVESLPSTILIPQGRLSISRQEERPSDNALVSSPKVQYLDAEDLELPFFCRPWKQGDYFYPLGMPKKKKLARFFIDNKLSATEKSRQWVLESASGQILAIPGHRIDHRFRVTASTKVVYRLEIVD